MLVFTALLTMAERWEQPKCPSVDEKINKRWHKYTMEYYSALKREDIPTHATKCLEAIKCSESATKEQILYDPTSVRYLEE